MRSKESGVLKRECAHVQVRGKKADHPKYCISQGDHYLRKKPGGGREK